MDICFRGLAEMTRLVVSLPVESFSRCLPGKCTRPGWVLERGELVFGERYNGVVLVLAKDLKRAALFHNSSGQTEKPTYRATPWRGDWQEEVVDGIEIWVED